MYCRNNPLRFIDPTGLQSKDPSLPRDDNGNVISVSGQLAEDSKWTEDEIKEGKKSSSGSSSSNSGSGSGNSGSGSDDGSSDNDLSVLIAQANQDMFFPDLFPDTDPGINLTNLTGVDLGNTTTSKGSNSSNYLSGEELQAGSIWAIVEDMVASLFENINNYNAPFLKRLNSSKEERWELFQVNSPYSKKYKSWDYDFFRVQLNESKGKLIYHLNTINEQGYIDVNGKKDVDYGSNYFEAHSVNVNIELFTANKYGQISTSNVSFNNRETVTGSTLPVSMIMNTPNNFVGAIANTDVIYNMESIAGKKLEVGTMW